MTRMETLPDGYSVCTWCSRGVRLPDNRTCPSCGMTNADPAAAAAKKPAGPSRRSLKAPRIKPLDLTPAGRPVLGVDPGYRYVGVVLRDGDAVLHASTLVRPDGVDDAGVWAVMVVDAIKAILVGCPANTGVAVETVVAPKGRVGGEKAPIDPKYILFTGVVYGAVANEWRNAAKVIPGNNGSQHMSHYPDVLTGRRPKDLPGSDNGAGIRDHVRSAYDVAGKAAATLHPPIRKPLL